MGSTIAAVTAARRRNERDAADPVGASHRNQLRALISAIVTAIWGGAALIVVSTVAPAAFRVLPSRSLAGALVGEVLPVLFIAGLAIGTVAFVLAPRGSPRMIVRRAGAAGMIVGCGVAQMVIAPRIAVLREKIGPSVEALAATDPLRVAFGQLHGLSVLALGVAMVFALLTVFTSSAAVRAAPLRD